MVTFRVPLKVITSLPGITRAGSKGMISACLDFGSTLRAERDGPPDNGKREFFARDWPEKCNASYPA